MQKICSFSQTQFDTNLKSCQLLMIPPAQIRLCERWSKRNEHLWLLVSVQIYYLCACVCVFFFIESPFLIDYQTSNFAKRALSALKGVESLIINNNKHALRALHSKSLSFLSCGPATVIPQRAIPDIWNSAPWEMKGDNIRKREEKEEEKKEGGDKTMHQILLK